MSRDTLLPVLAAHVLEHGLSGASLRPLARAAGTSDRMLLYHFGSKHALIEALLGTLTEGFATTLAAMVEPGRAASRAEALRRAAGATRGPAFRPVIALWWQIVAGAVRDEPGFRTSTGRIIDTMLAWIESQLPADDPDPPGGARALLAIIEGVHMLDAVGAYPTADAALEVLAADRPGFAGLAARPSRS